MCNLHTQQCLKKYENSQVVKFREKTVEWGGGWEEGKGRVPI